MRIFQINEGEDNYQFINSCRDTRTGFAHDCTLFINGSEQTEAHCYYINRTWEVYDYQSVCIKAINNLIKDFIKQNKAAYLQLNNYKILTHKRAEDLMDQLQKTPKYKSLTACRDALLNNIYY